MTPEENKEKDLQQEGQMARPNRDEYAKMWGEDNDDVDFEDKEARYGRAIEDRNELRERRKADATLGGLFDRHNWLAVMYNELKDNPDIDVFEWLECFCNENDLTIQEVLDNPEARKRLNAKLAEREQRKADAEAKANGMRDKLTKTYGEMKDAFPDKSDEEINQLWLDFWKVIEKAEEGDVDMATLKGFAHSLSYDTDVENARKEGAMQARNEKIQNNVRKPSEDLAGLPPTLSQGNAAPTPKKKEKKKSFAASMFEDIE